MGLAGRWIEIDFWGIKAAEEYREKWTGDRVILLEDYTFKAELLEVWNVLLVINADTVFAD